MRKYVLLGLLFLLSGNIFAADKYYSRTGAGGTTGANCANALAWSGTLTASPDDVLHICGTNTFSANVDGFVLGSSGTSGHPITIKFEPGAIVQSPVFHGGAIEINGLSWIVVDGGTPCGPRTLCNSNYTGSGTVGTGLIQNTDNGIGKTYLNDSHGVQANTCDNCEIKNLIFGTLCLQTAGQSFPNICPGAAVDIRGANPKIHDSTQHDAEVGFIIGSAGSGIDVGRVDLYNNDVYHDAWGIGTTMGTASVGVFLHDGHIHDNANWDTADNNEHKNGMHSFISFSESGTGPAAFYVYNMEIGGDWGEGHITAMLFEDQIRSPYYAWNNLFNPSTTPTVGQATVFEIDGPLFLYNSVKTGTTWGLFASFGGSTSVIENNVIEGCGQIFAPSGSFPSTGFASVDYNFYAKCTTGSDIWKIGSAVSGNGTSNSTTLAAWKLSCSCDAHSQAQALNWPNLDTSTGLPSAGFVGISAATNLTSIATGNFASLASDIVGVARPASSSWTAGAYVFGSPPGPPPVTLLSLNGSPPSGTAGSPYLYAFTASGGTPPYTWSGSSFPSGLSLSASGVLVGTPTIAGSFSPFIQVKDSLAQTAAATVALTIASATAPTILPCVFPVTINSSLTPPCILSAIPSGTVAVGSTSTTAPGTAATVTNTGTPLAGVFNFTIPQGVAGKDGLTPTSLSCKLSHSVYSCTVTAWK